MLHLPGTLQEQKLKQLVGRRRDMEKSLYEEAPKKVADERAGGVMKRCTTRTGVERWEENPL